MDPTSPQSSAAHPTGGQHAAEVDGPYGDPTPNADPQEDPLPEDPPPDDVPQDGGPDLCALEGCDVPLPARPLDEHGRAKGGRRPLFCCKGHADAASRQRRARDLAAVADPLAEVRAIGAAFLPAARDLADVVTALVTRFGAAEAGALGRVVVAEREAADAAADARAAQEAADAAEQARRQVAAHAREDRQARDNAVRAAERARQESEQVRVRAWEQVAVHERARGQAEAARTATERAAETLAAENRTLRDDLARERAEALDLTATLRDVRGELEATRRDLEAARVAHLNLLEEFRTAQGQRDAARDEAAARLAQVGDLRAELAEVGGRLAAERAGREAEREAVRADAGRVRLALAAADRRFDLLQAALERLTPAPGAAPVPDDPQVPGDLP